MSEKGEFKEAVKTIHHKTERAFAGLQIANDCELQSTEIGRVSLDIESTTFDGGISPRTTAPKVRRERKLPAAGDGVRNGLRLRRGEVSGRCRTGTER